MFNAFSDGAPDRWGRSLMQREERDRVRWTSTRPRSLTTADFLLGTRDELRQGAIRLRRPGAGNYWSDSDAAVPQLLFLAKLLAATDEFRDDQRQTVVNAKLLAATLAERSDSALDLELAITKVRSEAKVGNHLHGAYFQAGDLKALFAAPLGRVPVGVVDMPVGQSGFGE